MSMEETGWIVAAVAVVAWVITAARSTCSERPGRLLHRLLHQEPDGSWTWRVRGAKVPATRTTDVCLLIEPAVARSTIVRTAWLALYGGMRPATCPVPWSAGTVEVSSPSHT